MVRRTKVDGNRVWGLCFRLQGDQTSRTNTNILPEADAPDLADFTDEELLATLEPRSAARAELEAANRAEAERVAAELRAANAAAKAAKAVALQAQARINNA